MDFDPEVLALPLILLEKGLGNRGVLLGKYQNPLADVDTGEHGLGGRGSTPVGRGIHLLFAPSAEEQGLDRKYTRITHLIRSYEY